MVWDTFETTPAVSVQSLSLFVSSMIPQPLSDCPPFTIYARADSPRLVANVYCLVLPNLNTIMETSYPLSKLNLIALPNLRRYTDGGLGVIYVR